MQIKTSVFTLFLFTLFTSPQLLTEDWVTVENDTPHKIAFALVRTNKGHTQLDLNEDGSYKLPNKDNIDKSQISIHELAPGSQKPVENYGRDWGKLLKGVDRDLWISHDIKSLRDSLDAGKRQPKTIYYNVGSFKKKIYFGFTADRKLKAFTSQEKALNADPKKPRTVEALSSLPDASQASPAAQKTAPRQASSSAKPPSPRLLRPEAPADKPAAPIQASVEYVPASATSQLQQIQRPSSSSEIVRRNNTAATSLSEIVSSSAPPPAVLLPKPSASPFAKASEDRSADRQKDRSAPSRPAPRKPVPAPQSQPPPPALSIEQLSQEVIENYRKKLAGRNNIKTATEMLNQALTDLWRMKFLHSEAFGLPIITAAETMAEPKEYPEAVEAWTAVFSNAIIAWAKDVCEIAQGSVAAQATLEERRKKISELKQLGKDQLQELKKKHCPTCKTPPDLLSCLEKLQEPQAPSSSAPAADKPEAAQKAWNYSAALENYTKLKGEKSQQGFTKNCETALIATASDFKKHFKLDKVPYRIKWGEGESTDILATTWGKTVHPALIQYAQDLCDAAATQVQNLSPQDALKKFDAAHKQARKDIEEMLKKYCPYCVAHIPNFTGSYLSCFEEQRKQLQERASAQPAASPALPASPGDEERRKKLIERQQESALRTFLAQWPATKGADAYNENKKGRSKTYAQFADAASLVLILLQGDLLLALAFKNLIPSASVTSVKDLSTTSLDKESYKQIWAAWEAIFRDILGAFIKDACTLASKQQLEQTLADWWNRYCPGCNTKGLTTACDKRRKEAAR